MSRGGVGFYRHIDLCKDPKLLPAPLLLQLLLQSLCLSTREHNLYLHGKSCLSRLLVYARTVQRAARAKTSKPKALQPRRSAAEQDLGGSLRVKLLLHFAQRAKHEREAMDAYCYYQHAMQALCIGLSGF